MKKQISVRTFNFTSFVKSKLCPIFIAYLAVTRTTSPQSEWLSLKKFIFIRSSDLGVCWNCSAYMHTVPSRLACRSLRETPRTHDQLKQLHGLTLTGLTRNFQQLEQNTFSLQKGPCWSFEVNKPGKQTIFQHFAEVIFLAALKKVLKFLSNSRDGVCYVPRGFSQPIVLLG